IFAVSESFADYHFSIVELPMYAALGIVCGLIAILFNRTLHLGEDLYDKVPLHPMLKPVTGAILLGTLGVIFLVMIGDRAPDVPSFFGNGYHTIKFLLDPSHFGEDIVLDGAHALPTTWFVLGLLVLFKTVATTCTLASGGSGGVFAPSLFLGAAGGAAFGLVLDHVGLLPEGSSPAAYALVGMAAVVASSTHAPLTAILILFELTRDVYVLLPIMLAAVLAVVVAQLIDRDSIYTAKLRRQGVSVGTARDLTVLRRIHADMVEPVSLPPEPIYASDPLSKLITMHATHHVPDFVVTDTDGHYVGMVTGAYIRTALIDREAIPLLLVAELVRTDLPSVHPDDTLDTVLDKFAAFDIACLCMVDRYDPKRPSSIITRSRVMRRYQRELDKE
ncbi:MAG: chloride channel protein, partial [Phycisphaerales bacterium]|nr:chloride channel protein [Phycisphaerales bacterium]